MPEFAPVAPIDVLTQLNDPGHYHLLLVHEVMEHSRSHRDFWESPEHQDDFVILDNSVIELGYPAPVGVMTAWAGILPANTILVLPDVIGDMQGTLDGAIATLSSSKRTPDRFLGVVQGTTFGEAMNCAFEYSKMGLKFISVPRHLGDKLGTRIDLVNEIHARTEMNIHLLGFSKNVEDDLAAARQPGVIGIDSAVPIWSEHIFATNLHRPINYLEWVSLPPWANGNVSEVRTWLSGVKDAPTKVKPAGQGER